MLRKKTRGFLFCLAAVLPLPALASQEPRSPLTMTYDRDAREVPADTYTDLCPVRITVPVDARQNKETLGISMQGALLSGDMSKWLTDGLSDLKSYGANVSVGTDIPENGLLVQTSLTRAYTWQIGFKIFSMVAIKTRFVNKGGVLQEKYYRAHGDKTNIWGAESEYVTTLNYGINNLLPVLAKDIASLCKGIPVERYAYAGPAEEPTAATSAGLVPTTSTAVASQAQPRSDNRQMAPMARSTPKVEAASDVLNPANR